LTNVNTNTINEALKNLYGTYVDGRPKYRIVWSNDQYEYRKGDFNVFYKNFFLRSERGVKRVPKYNYIHDRWILEELSLSSNSELPESTFKGTYEPIYVFESSQGEYLKPLLYACKFFIYHRLNPTMNADQVREFFENKEAKEFASDVRYFETVLENESPHIASRLHDRDGIIINPYDGE
jgi:hypothetical protein